MGEPNWFSDYCFLNSRDEPFMQSCAYYINDGLDYHEINERIKQLKTEDLNNCLSKEDNIRLFMSKNILEIVTLVLKGLNNLRN